ncbi:MAG: nuclear transport factor 2 family protein [Byssovorax sp.]
MRLAPLLVLLGPLLVGCASAPPVPARFDLSPCPAPAEPPASQAVITGFYDAFGHRDFRGMACAYAPDIEFTDSIFGTLRGKRALAMWAMLTSQATDLTVAASHIQADGTTGQAHWDADYTFPFLLFHNHVDNHIDATFELSGGKITRHRDVFDLARWMSLALWPFGGVVSEGTIRDGVQKKLDDFIAEHPEFQDASPK